jgi:hypothetical protein
MQKQAAGGEVTLLLRLPGQFIFSKLFSFENHCSLDDKGKVTLIQPVAPAHLVRHCRI